VQASRLESTASVEAGEASQADVRDAVSAADI